MANQAESEEADRPLGELFTRITGEESVTEQRTSSPGRRHAEPEELELARYLEDRQRNDGLAESFDPADGDLDW